MSRAQARLAATLETSPNSSVDEGIIDALDEAIRRDPVKSSLVGKPDS